jgi:hypothetical protein
VFLSRFDAKTIALKAKQNEPFAEITPYLLRLDKWGKETMKRYQARISPPPRILNKAYHAFMSGFTENEEKRNNISSVHKTIILDIYNRCVAAAHHFNSELSIPSQVIRPLAAALEILR